MLPVGRHASESNDPVDIFLRRTLVRLDGELARCRELAACVLSSLREGRIRLGHSTLSSDKRNGVVHSHTQRQSITQKVSCHSFNQTNLSGIDRSCSMTTR